jgi:hypothetical protein
MYVPYGLSDQLPQLMIATPASFACTRREVGNVQKASLLGVSPSSLPRLPCTLGGRACQSPSHITPQGTCVLLGGLLSQDMVIAFGGVPVMRIYMFDK